MSEQVNYMQRVGHSRCIRCDFETSDDMTFEQQDAAMMAHLADKHPDWMGIGQVEPSPEPEAAPASEAQAPAVAENGLAGTLPPADYRRLSDYWMERTRLAEAEVYALRDELAQLRARVAILDAQEAGLPELPPESSADTEADYYELAFRARERQLLDALRAVQAWREVARGLLEPIDRHLKCDVKMEGPLYYVQNIQVFGRAATKAIAAYDALAGKDGE